MGKGDHTSENKQSIETVPIVLKLMPPQDFKEAIINLLKNSK